MADWNAGSRDMFESEGFHVKSRKLAIGPDRPARAIPKTAGWQRLLLREWLSIALIILGVGAIAALLTR